MLRTKLAVHVKMNFPCKMKSFFLAYRLTNYFMRAYSSVHERKKIVVITGCDSGLGYSLSLKCSQLGFFVVSGCLDPDSEGAKNLASKNYISKLDVRNHESIKSLRQQVNFFVDEKHYELHAVVNNAGLMVFGEFEWLTDQQISQHIDVNLMGYFRVAKEFLPLLRKHKGRLINITSHCSLANLPSLSVYGATKAAVQSWSDGLRVEQAKYGVKIITFIPGSLAMQSNIMSRQESYAKEMEKEFSTEQRDLYLEYFKSLNSHVISLTQNKKELKPIEDEALYEKFKKSLLDTKPKANYKHEPLRYFFYYNLFRFTPISVRDNLVIRFMKFPSFKQAK